MRVMQNVTKWHFIVAALLLLVIFIVISTSGKDGGEQVTATVERGSVTESVAISGFVEAKNTAHLSFPTTGITTDVMVEEGDLVKKGDILATLGSRTLVAQRSEAVAALSKARAAYGELLAGPSTEAREVTAQTQAAAQSAYQQTVALEAEKVKNARTALLSNDLTAYATDAKKEATPPTISGSYTCDGDGEYIINTYRSGAASGYSYTYSGLESGSDTVYTEQVTQLGSCGLTIVFDQTSNYGNTQWRIPIPNTKSPTYVTYLNAYELAQEAETAAIEAADKNRSLADREATLANAAPTSYESQQSRAAISQAQASIAAIDGQIAEKSIIAPFDGIITNVDIRPGETAGATPIITLLSNDAFNLTARVPEIDITKVNKGQRAEIVFDAQSDETLDGSISFLSPIATEIDGVAYFETTVTLAQTPEWMRAGLNADIDIITREATDAVRIPKRFIEHEDGHTYITRSGTDMREEVTVEFYGNDGYAVITGLTEGEEIVAPVITP